jgi:hypothetical protein
VKLGTTTDGNHRSFRPQTRLWWAEVEESTLKADLSTRPNGLGRGDKREARSALVEITTLAALLTNMKCTRGIRKGTSYHPVLIE